MNVTINYLVQTTPVFCLKGIHENVVFYDGPVIEDAWWNKTEC
jgi:hypothetical protein